MSQPGQSLAAGSRKEQCEKKTSRQIHEIYGLTPADEPAGKSLACRASGWQTALPNPARPENAALEAAGEGSGG